MGKQCQHKSIGACAVFMVYMTLSGHILTTAALSFNYNTNGDTLGVYNWPKTFSKSCGGMYQSPVDIRTNNVLYNMTSCECPRVRIRNRFLTGVIKNTGHSSAFFPNDLNSVFLSNVPNRPGQQYTFSNFHLHYGGLTEAPTAHGANTATLLAGSEHTINGFRFAGELHFVFYNTRYANLNDAMASRDGLVVLAFLIQEVPVIDANKGEIQDFSEFLRKHIPSILNMGQQMITRVDMNIFFGNRCEYYTYHGSTTTPMCTENVRWLVFRDPLLVTHEAWNAFARFGRAFKGHSSTAGTYRFTQPLNGRILQTNFGPQDQCSRILE